MRKPNIIVIFRKVEQHSLKKHIRNKKYGFGKLSRQNQRITICKSKTIYKKSGSYKVRGYVPSNQLSY